MGVDRGGRRWAVVLAALLAVGAPATAVLAAPHGTTEPVNAPSATGDDPAGQSPEPVSDAARAAAQAEPAIVLIEVQWEGYVHDRGTGDLLDPDPVSAIARCTGAGIGVGGYLLTTGSCLDQATVAAEAFQQVVDRRTAEGSMAEAEAQVLLGELLLSAVIGADPPADDPPERSVFVRRVVTDEEPIPATVVSIADPADGDAAVLKISRSNQPVLPLAGENDLTLGTELVTVACLPDPEGMVGVTPTTDDDGAQVEPLRPTYRTGAVIETAPRVLVEPSKSARPTSRAAGGVVLTHDAAIAGLVDTSLTTGDVLVDLDAIRDMLAGAEVDTGLGQVDRDYRAGLDAYYQGRYREAIGRFDSVLAIIPSHLQAHEYRDAAQGLRDEQNEVPPPTEEVVEQVESWLDQVRTWLGGRSWLVGVVVVIASITFLVRRRRPDDTTAPPEIPAGTAATGNPTEDAPAGDPGRR